VASRFLKQQCCCSEGLLESRAGQLKGVLVAVELLEAEKDSIRSAAK
jgi:hypothetical protein